MSTDSWLSTFYVAGGTLAPDIPSYVVRPADEELLRSIKAKEFCYVLTARQLGKSSLMVRAAIKLREENFATVVIDLTKIGTNVDVNQWYLGLITHIKRQLRLTIDPEAWWHQQASLGPVQRFIDFLHDIVLSELRGPVVIFVDEIDTTLKLDFSDDFFAAIRSIYNNRAIDTIYERLTFVLLGVATPAQLIKDRTQTPFNIGQAINLRDFNQPEEAEALKMGLYAVYPEYGGVIFKRIFYWTNGHPYLTQKLCLYAAETNLVHWTESRVDEIVERLFFSEEAARETNLQFVRDNISVAPDRGRLLSLYHRIYEGEVVYDDEKSPLHKRLKLIGLVTSQLGVLKVRNEIYHRVFNLAWIDENRPQKPTLSLRRALVVMFFIFVIGVLLGAYLFREQLQNQTIADQAQTAIDEFRANDFEVSDDQIRRLKRLYNLIGYEEQADKLFNNLTPTEQIALFTNLSQPNTLESEVVTVIKELYKDPKPNQNRALLPAMITVLEPSSSPQGQLLAGELQAWQQGRDYVRTNTELAMQAYNQAVILNGQNPATHFERGILLTQQDSYTKALQDFEVTVGLNQLWVDQTTEIILNNPALYQTWWQDASSYPKLSNLLKTPTSTSTPTYTPTHTPTPTSTATNTPTPTTTNTPTITPLPTNTASPTYTSASDTSTLQVELTATAIPPPTPQPANIIYVQSNGDQHSLGWVDWQGTLINNDIHQFAAAPIWSPNGQTIAFFGQAGINQLGGIYRAGSGIWTIDVTSGTISQRLQTDHITNMNWSPDGSKIVYEVKPPFQTFAEVVVINAITTEQLGRFPGEQPAWHDDNTQLAVKGCMPECGLWLFNQNGSNQERLTFDSTDSYPAWSPTGDYLAFSSRARAGNWELYLLRLNDGEIIRLTNRTGTDTTPVFSSDGQELYLRTDARTGQWQITAINLNTQAERVIQDNIGLSHNWGLARPAVQSP